MDCVSGVSVPEVLEGEGGVCVGVWVGREELTAWA